LARQDRAEPPALALADLTVVTQQVACEELEILDNDFLEDRNPHKHVQAVIDIPTLKAMRMEIRKGFYVSPTLKRYVIALVRATRPKSAECKQVVDEQAQLKGQSTKPSSAIR